MFKRTSDRRKNIIILALIFLVSLALMTFNVKRSEKPFFLESVVLWIVSPVQNFFTSIVDTTTDTFNHHLFLSDVSHQNELLREKNDSLLAENNELKEEIRRGKRVGGLLNHQDKAKTKSIVADIVGRDATQWSKMIFINKGYKHGVTENLPVVTNSGVVGHVIQASGKVSKVLLISDTRSAVDSLFQDSRETGVVVGAGEGLCKMKFVPMGASMKAGDLVLSSGLGGIYPKGLMVGTVIRQLKTNEGLFQEVTIKPSVDLNRLEEVLVLLPE